MLASSLKQILQSLKSLMNAAFLPQRKQRLIILVLYLALVKLFFAFATCALVAIIILVRMGSPLALGFSWLRHLDLSS